jgi:DNA repair exonuclease SbcCD ATPase subunit
MTAETVAEEVLRCKMKAYERIDEMGDIVSDLSGRLDSFEAHVSIVQTELKKHESQRQVSTKEIKEDIESLKEWFSHHDNREMQKYDEIIESLNELTQALTSVKRDTDGNTNLLAQKRIEEEKQRAIKEALDERDKPMKDIKHKAFMTATTLVTVAVLGGMFELIMFVVNLSNKIQG